MVDELVKKSRIAQASWYNLSLKERSKRIKPLGKIIARRADEISETISQCTGKTCIDALGSEVLPSSLAVGYYCKTSSSYLKPQKIKGGSPLFFNKVSLLHREPYGVIGIISPWNYPFSIPFQEVLMALMGGNSAILKVARQCQPLGELMATLFDELDIPENLFQLIDMPGSQAGEAFINSGMDKLFFTGSNAVGIQLASLASQKLMPISLELGGNDAMIVLKDANLERAAAGACWGGYSNCGQSCGGVERIFVEEAIYDEFAALLREKTSLLTQDHWKSRSSDLGSITTVKQLDTVKSHVADAIAKGAKITAQSQLNKKWDGGYEEKEGHFFYPATLLEGVTDEMLTMQDETFGPLLALTSVKDGEEAVKRANNSHLGLTASLWTQNRRLVKKYASQLQAGTITINDHLMSHGLPETPWGGYKQSSMGRSHGTPGLDEVTQTKVIIRDTLSKLPRQMWWYPHHKGVYTGLKSVMTLAHGPHRIKGLLGTVKVFLRSFSSH